jgi:hypothetical protein
MHNRKVRLVCILHFYNCCQCLITDWATRFRPSAEAKDFSSSLFVQTSSEAYPASYLIGTRGPFLGVKCGRGLMLTTHPHLMSRSRMIRSYISSPPWHLHDVAGQLYL